MKHLSLKARLTLLYTSMMILLFAFIIGLLFSVGSQAYFEEHYQLLIPENALEVLSKV